MTQQYKPTTIKRRVKTNQQFIEFMTEALDLFIEKGAINLTASDHRSLPMNALQNMWYSELSKQGDMTADEYRNFCKCKFGLVILMRDDLEMADLIRSVDWNQRAVNWGMSVEEAKMLFVSKMAVTSTFSTAQEREYLAAIKSFFEPKGFVLTDAN